MKRVLLLLLLVLLPIELSYAKGYKLGIVNGEDVIVRTKPGGKYLGVLPDGLVIKVISRSKEKHNIGDDSYYWYEVKFGNLKGWSYSKYLKVPKSQGSLKLDESNSLLHIYTKLGKLNIVKDLVEKRGFNPNKKDASGKSSLDISKEEKQHEITNYFLSISRSKREDKKVQNEQLEKIKRLKNNFKSIENDKLRNGGLIRGNFHLSELKKIYSNKIFKNGPHQNSKFNFQSKKDFGHYNLKFVNWVENELIPDRAGGQYYEFINTLITKYSEMAYRFKGIANTKCILEKKPKLFADAIVKFQKYLKDDSQKSFSPYTSYGYRENIDPLALAFWVRRHLDGTESAFRSLVHKIMQVFFSYEYEIMGNCLAAENFQTKRLKKTLYLVKGSFDDQFYLDVNKSNLACRDEIINKFSVLRYNMKLKKYPPTLVSSGQLLKDATVIRLCPWLKNVTDFYGLDTSVTTSPKWVKLKPNFTAKIQYKIEGCASVPEEVVSLNYNVEDYDFYQIGKLSRNPNFFEWIYPGDKKVSIQLAKNKTKLTKSKITLNNTIKEKIEFAYVVNDLKWYKDGDMPYTTKTVRERSEFWIKFKDGKKLLLFQNSGEDHIYDYLPSYIGRIAVTELNSDEELDFLIEGRGGKVLLISTRNGKIIRRTVLKVRKKVNYAGC